MSFIYVADGIDDVLAAHLNQYADAWSGVAGKGQPFNAVAVNDPINFAISARNLDPTNSRAAQFLKADGTVLFQCDASGVKVSPDGTVASVPVTVTSTQTLTNKTFTNPHFTTPVVDSGGLQVTAGNVGIGGAPVAQTAILVATGSTGGITILDPTKSAGYGATGLTLTGFRIGAGNGAVATLGALKGTATDGPVTGFSQWLYVVLGGFGGGWIPCFV